MDRIIDVDSGERRRRGGVKGRIFGGNDNAISMVSRMCNRESIKRKSINEWQAGQTRFGFSLAGLG